MATGAQPSPGSNTQRKLHKMASAHDLVHSGNFKSPLTQVRVDLAQTTPALPSNSTLICSNAPSVPALSLNLFRSASIYSVQSTSSLDTITSLSSSQDDDPSFVQQIHEQLQSRSRTPEVESPSTPTAPRHGASYFDIQVPSQSQPASGQTTPKKGFHVASRPPRPASPALRAPPRLNPPVSGSASAPASSPTASHHKSAFLQPEVDLRSAEPEEPPTLSAGADWASIHGEEGSEWGEDEETFEWLDKPAHAPEAPNGDPNAATPGRTRSLSGASGSRSSPSKRIVTQLKDMAGHVPHPNLGLGMGKEGRKLRKQMIVSRRAPPPPPLNLMQGDGSGAAVALPERTSSSQGSWSASASMRPSAALTGGSTTSATSSVPSNGPPTPKLRAGQDVVFGVSSRQNEPQVPPPRLHDPTMIALKAEAASSSVRAGDAKLNRDSIAPSLYSFYDLDAHPSTPTAAAFGSDLAFPRGHYMKLSASGPQIPPTTGSRAESPQSPDDLLAAGIEAKSAGDLAKSAWYFMRSAEGGNVAGRIYWGLALRHGWGVAKDDQKAFAELRRACDESMMESGMYFHQTPAAKRLTVQQNKDVKRDLSLGLFETANCFLDGVGVRKAPNVAIEYLRFAATLGDLASQEELGFLLSKGGHGIKKDMKEAARWYRMAINQGSSNTFGLAWVWKEKYMS